MSELPDEQEPIQQPQSTRQTHKEAQVRQWVMHTDELLVIEQQQNVEEPQDRDHLKRCSGSVVHNRAARCSSADQMEFLPHPDEEGASDALVHHELQHHQGSPLDRRSLYLVTKQRHTEVPLAQTADCQADKVTGGR